MYKNKFSSIQLLRMAFILWVAYFFVLALFGGVGDRSEITLYYAVHGINGFVILVLTWLPWKPLWLEKVIVPVTFVLMASLPTLTHHIMIGLVFNRETGPFDVAMWSLTPVHLIGLLLTAWRYQWRHVVIFSLATAGLNLIGLFIPPEIGFSFPPPPFPRADAPPPPPVNYPPIPALSIQTLSFLIIGYFTSTLNNRLRAQQHALSKANAELRAQARIEEELTISQERNRMARELHDTLARTLTGLSVQLQTVNAYWDIEPEASQEILDEAVVTTRSGLQEVRQALKALRAAPLEDLGLSLAIREVAESVAERGKLELRLLITEPLPSFTPEVSQCLYRVAQEAMMNVLYHANAKRLSVLLQVKDNGVQLTIEDDGIGFDVEGQYTGHWGVQGMRERAELVGGHLLLKSQPNHGTTIELYIPKGGT